MTEKELQKKYIDMIDNGIELSQDDIKSFIWDCDMKVVDEFQTEKYCWERTTSTILQDYHNRYFRVNWFKGVPHIQEYDLNWQPYEVIKRSKKATNRICV